MVEEAVGTLHQFLNRAAQATLRKFVSTSEESPLVAAQLPFLPAIFSPIQVPARSERLQPTRLSAQAPL
jgi:hypothetical protein